MGRQPTPGPGTPPLYLLHIMKTGGTSLVRAVRAMLGDRPCLTDLMLDDLVVLPRPVLGRSPFTAGHFGFEVTELLAPGTVVCTVLRDPLERTVSHYRHLRRDPAVLAEDPAFDLRTFLDSPRWDTLWRDYQARHLVHGIGIAQAWTGWSPPERFAALGPPFPPSHPLPLQSLFDCTALRLSGSALLTGALARLDEIGIVGVTDDLDGVAARIARLWGVDRAGAVERANVDPDPVRPGDLPAPIEARIRAGTAVDRELYEAARRRSRRPSAFSVGPVSLPESRGPWV